MHSGLKTTQKVSYVALIRLFNFCFSPVFRTLFFSQVFMVDEEASFYYVNPHDASSFPLKTFLKNKV